MPEGVGRWHGRVGLGHRARISSPLNTSSSIDATDSRRHLSALAVAAPNEAPRADIRQAVYSSCEFLNKGLPA